MEWTPHHDEDGLTFKLMALQIVYWTDGIKRKVVIDVDAYLLCRMTDMSEDLKSNKKEKRGGQRPPV